MLMRDPAKERNNGTSPLSKAAEKLAKKNAEPNGATAIVNCFCCCCFSVLRFVVFLWSSA